MKKAKHSTSNTLYLGGDFSVPIRERRLTCLEPGKPQVGPAFILRQQKIGELQSDLILKISLVAVQRLHNGAWGDKRVKMMLAGGH